MAVDRIGDGLALRSKGDIVSHDGTANIVISSGTNGQILYAQSSATAGVQWQTPPVAETQDMEIIASSINTSGAAIEFTNIPNTYKHLYLRWAVKSTSLDELAVRFNGVTSGSYQYTQTVSSNAIDHTFTSGAGQVMVHNIDTSGDLFSPGEMTIMSYSNTSYYKNFQSYGGYFSGTYYYSRLTQGTFASTSAITSIRLYEKTNTSLATGSHVTLFGIKG